MILLRDEDSVVTFENGLLTMTNGSIRRVVELASLGAPRTVELSGIDGVNRAAAANGAADFAFVGLEPPTAAAPWQLGEVRAESLPQSLLDGAAVRVTVDMTDVRRGIDYRREYFLYRGLPVIGTLAAFRSAVTPNVYWNHRGLNGDAGGPPHGFTDSLLAAGPMTPKLSVRFRGRTDLTDDLVEFVSSPAAGRLGGNLLFASDSAGTGFFLFQESPPDEERRDFENFSFIWSGHRVESCNWGVHPAEVVPGQWQVSDRTAVGIYTDRAGAVRSLKAYQRLRFPSDPRHRAVVVNPWGCGRFRELADADFLVREISAAAECGATHYQIDDGWQRGGTLNEITVLNHRVTPDYWEVSERLGGSLSPLREAADRAGIKLALWMAPSVNCEYDDWRAFADTVLKYHREYGIGIFKFDGVKLRSSRAARNFRSLLERLKTASGGGIFINMDTTNGQRPGYCSFLEFGNIFLENRYLCHTWGRNYHPEKALRNLWRLSRLLRPQNFQIEVANPLDYVDGCFHEAGFCDPRDYPWEYWLAVPMFASPLLWFAPSLLPEAMRRRCRTVMELHRRWRDRIMEGEIFPIGDEPDGRSFTGFVSRHPQGLDTVIVYREIGAAAGRSQLVSEQIPAGRRWRTVGGAGEVLSVPGGLDASVPAAPGFVLAVAE